MEEPLEVDPPKKFEEKLIKNDDAELKALAADMPAPVQDAIDAASSQETVTAEKIDTASKDFTDNKGRKFDPTIHQWDDKTNEPARTGTGRFKRKLNIPHNTTSMGQQAPIDPLMVEAQKYADMFIIGGMGFVGDEFKPAEGERESLVVAWHGIFQKYGIMPIHPIYGVIIAHSLYIFRRYDRPRTQSLVNRAFNGIKFAVINAFYKLQGKDFKVVPKDGAKI